MRDCISEQDVQRARAETDSSPCVSCGSVTNDARHPFTDARRRPPQCVARSRARAGRGNTWSYYVFRRGLRMLLQRGSQQPISITGLSEAIVFES
jgi:hypothetical protein